jgi:putative oxidoreductase
MRVARLIARILLGLVFTVFGLNGFLHFLPMPPMSGPPAEFFAAMFKTGYMLNLIFGAQVIGGVLVLAGVFVPLGLTILAPVIVNIFFFHLHLDPSGLPLALIVVILEVFMAWCYRDKFAPLFSS